MVELFKERFQEYEDLAGGIKPKTTTIQKEVFGIDEVVAKIVETFKTRDFEAKIRFPKGEYKKEHLPPENEIKEIVVNSMRKVGIKSGVLTEDYANRIFKAFQTLFRARGSTIVLERTVNEPRLISTKKLEKESVGVGGLKHGNTVFFTDEYKKELKPEQTEVLNDLIKENYNLSRNDQYALVEVSHYLFKTPVSAVITNKAPEERFLELLTKSPLCAKVDAWIKSRDMGFYSVEYSWRKGEHPTQGNFNPDFFLKLGENIVVIEIKADNDDSDENKAKYR